MPEILTKYPDVILNVLTKSGIKCNTAESPKILKTCPKTQFCSLPYGEICVYGLNDINEMTQISSGELTASLAYQFPMLSVILIILFIIVFGFGFILGRKQSK